MGESVALQFRRLRLGVGHRCHQRSYLLGVVAGAQTPHARDDADPLGTGCDAFAFGGGFDRLHGLGSVSWGGLALGLVGFAGARGDSKLVGFGLLWPGGIGVGGCGGAGDRNDGAPTLAIALTFVGDQASAFLPWLDWCRSRADSCNLKAFDPDA